MLYESNMASRYEKDFLEVEKIGLGNLEQSTSALERLDGCVYAIRCSMKTLGGLSDENLAMHEVYAHVVLGHHSYGTLLLCVGTR